MNAIELYNEAIHIDKTSPEQRHVFDYWANHHSDPVYQILAFDTEATSVTFGVPSVLHTEDKDVLCKDAKVFGISLCIPYKDRLVLVWGRLGTHLFNVCKRLLAVSGPKVAHNSRYDVRVCRASHIRVADIIHCTLTMSRIHWNRRIKHGLKDLTGVVCSELYDYDAPLKAVIKNIRAAHTRAGHPPGYCNYSFIPNDIISEYSKIDAFICWMLNFELMPHMQEEHKEVYARERKVIRVVIAAELRGMHYSRKCAKQEASKIQALIPQLKYRLTRLARKRFNPNSPPQVLDILLNRLDVPKKLLTKRDKHGKARLTTEKETIESLKEKVSGRTRRFVETLLNLRSCYKLLGTYLLKFYTRAQYNHGIVFCNINPTDTRTGRMSSNDPNLENIPRPATGVGGYNPVRKCFTPRYNYDMFFADYSQMEMWLYAFTVQVRSMLDALLSGKDVHAQTAFDMLGRAVYDRNGEVLKEKRTLAKRINFSIIYGMGPRGLAKKLEVTQLRAIYLKEQYNTTYPGLIEFINRCKHDLIHKGYVQDIFGKRYNIEPRQAYKAVNALVQGGCAQILKIALIKMHKHFESFPHFNGQRAHILLPIHDEIIFEFPKYARPYYADYIPSLVDCMEEVPQLMDKGIRLKVDLKRSAISWEDKYAVSKTGNKATEAA